MTSTDELERLHQIWLTSEDEDDAFAFADACGNALPELLALREEVGRLREALRLGKVVMDLLDKHGPSIVPHLLDTDENAGQRFRAALNQEPGQ